VLYDFTSKEDLVMAVLAEVRRRESLLLAEHLNSAETAPPDLIRTIRGWLVVPERAPFMRLFFEVYVQAMNHPDAYSAQGRALVTEWLDQFNTALTHPPTDPAGPVSATMVIAVLRGLLLDWLSTGHQTRTNDAMEQFARLVHQR
jgi:AcrR family transcriptional regulator